MPPPDWGMCILLWKWNENQGVVFPLDKIHKCSTIRVYKAYEACGKAVCVCVCVWAQATIPCHECFIYSFACLVYSCESMVLLRPDVKLFLISDQFLPDLSPMTIQILSLRNRRGLVVLAQKMNKKDFSGLTQVWIL